MSGISLRIQLRKIINRLLELQIAEESDTSWVDSENYIFWNDSDNHSDQWIQIDHLTISV